MTFEWDDAKRASNLLKHGVDFARMAEFDWQTVVIDQDVRQAYGEPRFHALGLLDGRVHAVVFTVRQSGVRVISMRKANAREGATYEARA